MRAVIYARISRDTAGHGLGVDRQVQDCHALAKQRGWTVAQEFIDNDVSAFAEKRRPQYQAMLGAIDAGSVQAVIVWDLDRLTRRPVEIEEFISLADRHSLKLASVGGDVDLSTDNGRMYARIKGAVARAESERKSTRHKRAVQQKAAMGMPPDRRAFGYPGVDQRPEAVGQGLLMPAEIVGAEARAVRDLWAAALAGDSILALLRQMQTTGLSTTRGTAWSRGTIRWMLLNPRYAGLQGRDGVVTGRGNWEPLIPEETWYAVVGRLKDPNRTTNSRRTTSRIHLLGDIALCGVCNDGTTVKTSYAGTGAGVQSYRIYRCRKSGHLGRRADYIDEYVQLVIVKWASSPEAEKYLVQQSGPDMGELRQQEATLTIRLDQLAESFADGHTSDQQLRVGSARLRAKLGDVQQAMRALSSAGPLGDLIGQNAEAVWETMNLDRRRQAIKLAFAVTLLGQVDGRRVSSRFDPASVDIRRPGQVR